MWFKGQFCFADGSTPGDRMMKIGVAGPNSLYDLANSTDELKG